MTPQELFNYIKNLSDADLFTLGLPFKIDYIMIPHARLGSCGVTARAILAGIFQAQTVGNTQIHQLKEDVLNKETLMRNKPAGYVYGFEILFVVSVKKPDSDQHRYVDHKFTVIMYKTEASELRYRFIQAFYRAYNLKKYFEDSERDNNSHDLSHQEFMTFLNELYHFSKSKIWDEKAHTFFLRYFKVNFPPVNYEILFPEKDKLKPIENNGARFYNPNGNILFSINAFEKDLDHVRLNNIHSNKILHVDEINNLIKNDALKLKAVDFLMNVRHGATHDEGLWLCIEKDVGSIGIRRIELKYKSILDAYYDLQNTPSSDILGYVDARVRLEEALSEAKVYESSTQRVFNIVYQPNKDSAQVQPIRDNEAKQRVATPV